MWERLPQHWGQFSGRDLGGAEGDDGLVHGVARIGDGCQLPSARILSNDRDLDRRQEEPFQRQTVAAGVEAVVLDDSRESGQGVFGFGAKIRASAQGFEAKQDCRGG